jgi:hypothetical protein
MFITAVSEVPEAEATQTFSNGVPCTALLGTLRREEVLERIGFLHLIRSGWGYGESAAQQVHTIASDNTCIQYAVHALVSTSAHCFVLAAYCNMYCHPTTSRCLAAPPGGSCSRLRASAARWKGSQCRWHHTSVPCLVHASGAARMTVSSIGSAKKEIRCNLLDADSADWSSTQVGSMVKFNDW